MRDFVSRVTWVDCVALLAIARGIYVGYRSGFFAELLRLASYILALGITLFYQKQLAEFLTLNTFLNQEVSALLAFVSLFIGVFLVAKLIVFLLRKLLKVGEGGFFNGCLGALTGVCRWLVILSLVFMVIDQSPFSPLKKDIHNRSMAGPRIARMMPAAFEFFSQLSPQFELPKKAL